MILTRRFTIAGLAAFCLQPVCTPALFGQTSDNSLSDAEVEQVRNSRYVPSDAILLFVKFLDERVDRLTALYHGPRRPGREDDTNDLLQQFTSICDELSDNLDDYGPRHADLRRALPKLLSSADRWATAIKSPPENETYAVSRKLAFESLQDLRDSANELSTEQTAWFKTHHPDKQKASEQESDVICIPR